MNFKLKTGKKEGNGNFNFLSKVSSIIEEKIDPWK